MRNANNAIEANMKQEEMVNNIIAQLYAGQTPKEKAYTFPLYIRNRGTRLVYKLLTSYEDRPAGLYTRRDDFEKRVLLPRKQLEQDWEVV